MSRQNLWMVYHQAKNILLNNRYIKIEKYALLFHIFCGTEVAVTTIVSTVPTLQKVVLLQP